MQHVEIDILAKKAKPHSLTGAWPHYVLGA